MLKPVVVNKIFALCSIRMDRNYTLKFVYYRWKSAYWLDKGQRACREFETGAWVGVHACNGLQFR